MRSDQIGDHFHPPSMMLTTRGWDVSILAGKRYLKIWRQIDFLFPPCSIVFDAGMLYICPYVCPIVKQHDIVSLPGQPMPPLLPRFVSPDDMLLLSDSDDESCDDDVIVISDSDDDDTVIHDGASYAKAVSAASSGGTDYNDAPDRGGNNDDSGADSDEDDGGHLVQGARPDTTAGPSRMSTGLWQPTGSSTRNTLARRYHRRPLIRRGEFTSWNVPAPAPELTTSSRPRAGTGCFSLILLITLFLFASFLFLIS